MKAYKLIRKRKDGSYGPLFINRKLRIEFGKVLYAEDHKTNGYAHRPGWHCTFKPEAPHLSTKDREWCEVEVNEFRTFDRPKSQGGQWILADQIKFIKII